MKLQEKRREILNVYELFCRKKVFKGKTLVMECKRLDSLKTNPRLWCDTNALSTVQ